MGRRREQGKKNPIVLLDSKLNNLSKLIWVKYPTVYTVHEIGWGQILIQEASPRPRIFNLPAELARPFLWEN